MWDEDPKGFQEFIVDNHPEDWNLVDGSEEENQWSKEKIDSFRRGYHIDRRFVYLQSRFGGMGYGPGFRQVKTAYQKGTRESDKVRGMGMATLVHREDRDPFEDNVVTHAGMYDQM